MVPLQFCKLSDLPLQFTYLKICYYNSLFASDVPFCTYLISLDARAGSGIYKNTHAPSPPSAHLLMGPTFHQLLPFPPQSTSVGASRVHRRRHAPCSAPFVVTARPDLARASLLPLFNPRLDDVAGVEAGEARAVADAVDLLRAPAAQPCIPLPVPEAYPVQSPNW